MGTSDFDDMGYRDYRKTINLEVKRVRRAVFWWRVRTWALVAVIVLLPSLLMAWLVWSMR